MEWHVAPLPDIPVRDTRFKSEAQKHAHEALMRCDHLQSFENTGLVIIAAEHYDWQPFRVLTPQLLTYLYRNNNETAVNSAISMNKSYFISRFLRHVDVEKNKVG